MTRGGFLRGLLATSAASAAVVLGRNPVSVGPDGRITVDADGNVVVEGCRIDNGIEVRTPGQCVIANNYVTTGNAAAGIRLSA